jgi:signal transduction histidine kinase/ActR/RegA family two-component response regulator
VPVLVGSQVRAVLELFGEEVRPLDGRFVDVLSQVGTLLGRVIEREQAQRELREANAALSRALVDLQGAQAQIVQQERLSALGQMASGIAHDFNNALHPIVGYAELLLEHPAIAEAEHASRYVQNILTSARDAAAVVSRLREFYRARDEKDSQAPVDLGMLVEQVVDLTRPRWYSEALAAGTRIHVTARVEPVERVMAHEPQLREALINLVLNAVDAMPGGGDIEVSARMQDGRVVVAVRDTGTGMTEEVRRQCLEPFFTTKGSRGSGLGLGMVYGIVQRHDGLLDIASAPGMGTTVTLSFPPTGRHAAPRTASESAPAPRRILLVDDQAVARESLREVLEIDGHHVETAESGVEAVARLLSGSFDVVVTDRSMPEMNGDELARFVKESRPTLPVIMITGFGVLMASAGEQPAGVDLVLPKPVSRAALRAGLREVSAAVNSAA